MRLDYDLARAQVVLAQTRGLPLRAFVPKNHPMLTPDEVAQLAEQTGYDTQQLKESYSEQQHPVK